MLQRYETKNDSDQRGEEKGGEERKEEEGKKGRTK